MPAPKGTRPPAAGRGRPKGAGNKVSGELKAMILGTLDKSGGEQYFVEREAQWPRLKEPVRRMQARVARRDRPTR
jgi:hypothetical protein